MKNFLPRLSLTVIFFFIAGHSAFAQLPTAAFNANVTSACVGSTQAIISFTSTSTGNPTSYDWDFGDAVTSTDPNPSHIYSTPGLYTVILTVTNGTGSDTETKVNYIRIWENPTASFSLSDDTVCSTTPIVFTSTSTPGDGAITQYNWTFNDGSAPVTGVNFVSHQFIFSGTSLQLFYPNLLISDVNGCNSSISDTISVFPEPIAGFTANPNGGCLTPALINFTNTSQFTNQYSWNFGDTASGASNTSTAQNPNHTYNSIGTYTVTLIAGVPGCSTTETTIITIANPVANFSASDTVICLGDTVSFTNTGTTGNFFWDFADPLSGSDNTSNLADPTHIFASSGTHDVTMTVTIGTCSNTFTKTITVRPRPVPNIFAPTRFACDTNFVVNFTDTVSSHVSWSWDFGDPASGAQNTSGLQNPTHSFNAFGSYSITQTVTDNFGCTASATFPSYIQIIRPTIDFLETDSGCVGESFTFNATVSSPADPVITDYTWRFADGTGLHSSGTSPSITHTFNTVGLFDVTLTITTSTGCTATLIKPQYIKIGTPPVANFSAVPLVICFKDNVQFTDLTPSPVTGWQWSFGDGGGSTNQNPNHQYNIDTSGTADPFDVELIAYYNGCPDTIELTDYITVQGPIPDFRIIYNCPSPYSVDFGNLSGGATSYSWDFGDASAPSVLSDPTHVYAARGDYDVVLTATSTVSGCTVDSTYTVQVRDPDAITSTDTTVTCRPGVINFTGSASIDANQQVWYFGEGIANVLDTSFFSDTLHLYNSTGFFDALYTITDIHGCTDTALTQIHIIGPTAGFTAAPFTGCAPILVTFNDTSLTEGGAINQWVWNYGSITRTITTPPGTDTLTYDTPGNYTVILTVTDVNGCSNSATATNYIQATKPVPYITPMDTGCRDVSQIFTAYPGAFVANPVTYDWDFGDNTNASVQTTTVNHAYSANGSYPLKLTVTDANGCVDSTTSNVFIYTTPASFSSSLNDTCVDQNGIKRAQIISIFTSDSNSYAANYTWDVTATTLSDPSLSSAFYIFDVPGVYDVELIIENRFGCTDTLLKPGLAVLTGPVGSYTYAPDSGCSPLTVNFNGSASNVNYYAWDFG
nr:PKD domain-containing protein [Bacteroidia bacterium]